MPDGVVAPLFNSFRRKIKVGNLSFLQGQKVGIMGGNYGLKLVQPGANAVDVKRDDFHGGVSFFYD